MQGEKAVHRLDSPMISRDLQDAFARRPGSGFADQQALAFGGEESRRRREQQRNPDGGDAIEHRLFEAFGSESTGESDQDADSRQNLRTEP